MDNCKIVDITNGLTSIVETLPAPKREGAGIFSKGKPIDTNKINEIQITITNA